MKQINLVPLGVRQKAANLRSVPFLVLAGLAGLALPGLLWAGLSIQVGRLTAQQETLVQEAQEREAKASAEMADIQVDADTKARVDQLNTLAKTDINWPNAFAYVASILPKDVKVLNYSLGTSTSGTQLKLTAVAPSNVSYATFVQFLKDNAGKLVTNYKVEGYVYDPRLGTVNFSLTVTVPASKLTFTPAS